MLSLRLVLDTNVLVSAALNPRGLTRSVFLLAITKPARLYVSTAILQEYRSVLARPELAIRRGQQLQLMDLLRNRSHLVSPSRTVRTAIDPDDHKFLECADEARADYLVTANVRHFPQFWKSTKIITPHEFAVLIAPHLTY